MINCDKIKGMMREQRKGQEYMADIIKKSVPTFNSKINEKSQFDAIELKAMADNLGCTVDFFYAKCL